MRRTIANVRFLFGLTALLGVIPGCAPGTLLEGSGVALKPPTTWQPVHPTKWMVPGTPLAAWSGPDGSSLVIYRTLWVPNGSAEMLLEAQGNRLENLPGTKLLVKRVETIASLQAARIELIAPGTGGAVAPSGLGEPIQPPGGTLVPTRQVMLAFARPTETIYVTWHMPERAYDRIEPDIRATLESLRFSTSAKTSYRK